MAGVESVDNLPACAISLVEIHRSYSVALQADSEKFRFDATLHPRKILLEDFVEGGSQYLTVALALDGELLLAVMYPDIHDAWITLSLAHRICDTAATLRMLDPELPDGRIRIGEGKVTALRMAE